jgi:hypothetical protein
MNLILPRLGVSMNASEFLALAQNAPGATKVCFGIVKDMNFSKEKHVKYEPKPIDTSKVELSG